MSLPRIAPPEVWLAARKQPLDEEKDLTRRRDALNARRRELPMVEIDKPYGLDLTAVGRQEDWEEPRDRAASPRGALPDFASARDPAIGRPPAPPEVSVGAVDDRRNIRAPQELMR